MTNTLIEDVKIPQTKSAAEAAREHLAETTKKAYALLPHLEFMESLSGFGITVRHDSDFDYAHVEMHNPTKETLLALVKVLVARGYHIRATMDLEELKIRVYDYGPVNLFVHFTDPGAACAFVQVGTKTQPVYKFQCEGEAV